MKRLNQAAMSLSALLLAALLLCAPLSVAALSPTDVQPPSWLVYHATCPLNGKVLTYTVMMDSGGELVLALKDWAEGNLAPEMVIEVAKKFYASQNVPPMHWAPAFAVFFGNCQMQPGRPA